MIARKKSGQTLSIKPVQSEILLPCILIFFGFWAQASELVTLNRLVAYVNTQPILQTDLEHYKKTLGLRSQIDPLYSHSALAEKGKAASSEEIINSIINDRLISKEFPKADSEVEQEINTIQNTNHISRQSLIDALRREGYDFADYFELIRDSASKKELISREIQTKISISDDDIKNYYLNQLPKHNMSHRAFHIGIISISPKNYKSPQAALKIAQDTLKRLKSGSPFEETAKSISDDPTASLGGDLGFLNDDQINPAIKAELKDLKIGQISEIFDDPSGRHFILKLYDIRSTETEQMEKMKDEIRGKLMAKEYEQQVGLWVERKRQSAVIHIEK